MASGRPTRLARRLAAAPDYEGTSPQAAKSSNLVRLDVPLVPSLTPKNASRSPVDSIHSQSVADALTKKSLRGAERKNSALLSSRKASSREVKKHAFDINAFLSTLAGAQRAMVFRRKETIFSQGDAADAVFYLLTGKVRLTVVSQAGKEATIAILSDESFFGEGSLAGQIVRMGSVLAMTDCAVLRIERKAMMAALHREHTFSDMFVAYLLTRNIRYEEDLVDQLFNSSEKRLARVLLMLARFGKESVPETVIPKISQETLAEMVGTTRSRVSFFMNRFRKLGFIHYAGREEGALQVHSSLLNVVLHD